MNHKTGKREMDKDFFQISDQLIIWRPKGILDIAKIYDFIKYLDEVSKERDPHFSRFIDLSQIDGISVNYNDLSPIAEQRRKYYDSTITQKIKMAFYITNPLSLGMARMYQTLVDESLIEINIYENLEDCSQFLDVDISILTY